MNPSPSTPRRASTALGGSCSDRGPIEVRLGDRLRQTGVSCWVTPKSLALPGHQRPVTAADWRAVIGWLLSQPEVVFVAREFPVTRSSLEQAQ
jgi:hypothetical protein